MASRILILLLFTFTGLIVGCSITRTTDQEFTPYIRDFERTTNRRNATWFVESYPVVFRSSDNHAGVCYTATHVEVDPEYWYRKGARRRQELINHELGHCVCNLPHNENLLKDGCPESAMFPTTISAKCLNKHWDHYNKRMKKECN